jgi:hypothetical protein
MIGRSSDLPGPHSFRFPEIFFETLVARFAFEEPDDRSALVRFGGNDPESDRALEIVELLLLLLF